MDGAGGGGKWCHFKVINKGDGIVNLQSNEFGAKEGNERFHVGGTAEHEVKDPSETGRGGAGSWQVYRCEGEEGDPKKCTGENPLHKPGVYIFESIKGGKNLRIKEDGSVDVGGGNGKWARFVVSFVGGSGGGAAAGGGTRKVKLQSRKWGGYLRITDGGEVDGKGTGGSWTSFIVHNHGEGKISLQSEFHHKTHADRMHLGAKDDGTMKDPSETGRGTAGTWHVIRVKGDPNGTDFKECSGDDPLHVEGTYIFKSAKGGKNLLIREDGSVDAKGGMGAWVRFTVTHC